MQAGDILQYNNGVDVYTVVVVEADLDIGLTLVDVNDPDHYLVCLNGPLSPMTRDDIIILGKSSFCEPLYRKIYNYISNCELQNIPILASDMDSITRTYSRRASVPSQETCAFGR